MLEIKYPSIHIPKILLILKSLNPQTLRQIVKGTEHACFHTIQLPHSFVYPTNFDAISHINLFCIYRHVLSIFFTSPFPL